MNRSLVALVIAGCVAVVGCSSATADSAFSGGSETANAGPTGGSTAGGAESAPSPGARGNATDGPNPSAPQKAGQLTAGVWDDNLNYDFFNKYLDQSKGLAGASMISAVARNEAHTRAIAPHGVKTELDVGIVLDTTSSMGDEIKYLQAELDSIVTILKTKFPQVTPRFGLVAYKDKGDEYLTRSIPFTTDVAAFRASLAAQSAGGGGDIPEAVPEGLADAVALEWRSTDESARVMFWLADAPEHAGTEQAVATALVGAVAKGIHVYPVASSGVNGAAELTMRTAAQVTGGRYIFLTDDSGIGNSHAEPHIPCYVVTPLQGALVRMIESEMKGQRVEPDTKDVLRTVGSPTAGKCALQDKSEVVLY